jgi:hypothetical protein
LRLLLVILTLLSLDFKGDAEDNKSSVSPFLYNGNYLCLGISDPNRDSEKAFDQAVKRALAFYAISQQVEISSLYELYYMNANAAYSVDNQKSHWMAELSSSISGYSYNVKAEYRTKYNETIVLLEIENDEEQNNAISVSSSFMYYFESINGKTEYGEKQVVNILSHDDINILEWVSVIDKTTTSKLSYNNKSKTKIKPYDFSYEDYGIVTDDMLFSDNKYGLWNSYIDTFFQAISVFESNNSLIKSTNRQVTNEINGNYEDKSQDMIRSVMKTQVSCLLVNISLKNNKFYASWNVKEK